MLCNPSGLKFFGIVAERASAALWYKVNRRFRHDSLRRGRPVNTDEVALPSDRLDWYAALRQTLTQLPQGRRIIVHILPRILPTQFRPDGSPNPDYEWGELLIERSEMAHRWALTGGAKEQARLAELDKAIPEPVRRRYDELVRNNEFIMESLLEWAEEGLVTYWWSDLMTHVRLEWRPCSTSRRTAGLRPGDLPIGCSVILAPMRSAFWSWRGKPSKEPG